MPTRRSAWKKEWKEFAAQAPGRRFRDRYEHRSADRSRAWWRKALNVSIGLVLLALGLFFAVAPGPAVFFFAGGGLLIANESRVAAHLLDRVDVLLAPLLKWLKSRWHKLSRPARRAATVCVISGSVLAIAAGCFVLIMR